MNLSAPTFSAGDAFGEELGSFGSGKTKAATQLAVLEATVAVSKESTPSGGTALPFKKTPSRPARAANKTPSDAPKLGPSMGFLIPMSDQDRKSTRLNSSH